MYACLSLFLAAAVTQTAPDPLFPTPTGMDANVEFWLKVYTEWPTNRYAIHDDRQLNVVYRVIEANDGREPKVKKAKSDIEASLSRLDSRRPRSAKGLKGVDLEVYRALSATSQDPLRFSRARGHVRHQKGQADRFRQALYQQSRYGPQISSILKANGLPSDLMALIFVESMFNLNARSYSGALGLWQFMRATGREYLNINSVVDERRDPIIATHAACSYLRSAKKRLHTWPVAITSYNYGMNGMARAERATGSTDLAVILKNYRTSRLGFAAKNYYTEFLAALKVMRHPNKYFPGAKLGGRWRYDVIRLPAATTASALIRAKAVSKKQLKSLNPALTRDALAGSVKLPQGMSLRLPAGHSKAFLAAFQTIPNLSRSRIAKSRTYQVKKGDNVTAIARRYGVTTGQVLAANNLARDRAIHPGMKLTIPPKRSSTTLLPEARNMEIPKLSSVAVAAAPVQPAADPVVAMIKPATKPKAQRSANKRRLNKRRMEDIPLPEVRKIKVRGRRALVVAGPVIAAPSAPLELESEIGVDVLTGPRDLPAVDILTGVAVPAVENLAAKPAGAISWLRH